MRQSLFARFGISNEKLPLVTKEDYDAEYPYARRAAEIVKNGKQKESQKNPEEKIQEILNNFFKKTLEIEAFLQKNSSLNLSEKGKIGERAWKIAKKEGIDFSNPDAILVSKIVFFKNTFKELGNILNEIEPYKEIISQENPFIEKLFILYQEYLQLVNGLPIKEENNEESKNDDLILAIIEKGTFENTPIGEPFSEQLTSLMDQLNSFLSYSNTHQLFVSCSPIKNNIGYKYDSTIWRIEQMTDIFEEILAGEDEWEIFSDTPENYIDNNRIRGNLKKWIEKNKKEIKFINEFRELTLKMTHWSENITVENAGEFWEKIGNFIKEIESFDKNIFFNKYPAIEEFYHLYKNYEEKLEEWKNSHNGKDFPYKNCFITTTNIFGGVMGTNEIVNQEDEEEKKIKELVKLQGTLRHIGRLCFVNISLLYSPIHHPKDMKDIIKSSDGTIGNLLNRESKNLGMEGKILSNKNNHDILRRRNNLENLEKKIYSDDFYGKIGVIPPSISD